MTAPSQALIVDLVAWVAAAPRTYAEVMEAWRSSCPRLTIWEDALDLGYLVCERSDGLGTVVRVTAAGRALLGDAERYPSYPVIRRTSSAV